MQLSKNAIGNLINRYKAVLKKCTLINTFGSLAVVGMLTAGGVLAMPMFNVASFADAAHAASVATASGDGYIIEVKDPSKTYFKEFSVNDGSSTTTYGILFKGTDYAADPTKTHSSIDKLVVDVITSQKSSVPAGEGNYFKEIVEVNSGDAYTFNVKSKNENGNDVTLYFAMKDANDTFITSTDNRITNLSTQIFDNFIGNSANFGGAINNTGSISNITSSSFIGNSASIDGGAINNTGSISNITSSSFISNSATDDGGAIFNNFYATISAITASSFIGNSADDGGAIYNSSGSISNIISSNFTSNSAAGQHSNGGAIHNDDSISNITSSSFTGNSAAGQYSNGGAIYNTNTIYAITSSNFTGNSATASGGAIYNFVNIEDITASSFIGNSATNNGGAIYNDGTINAITASSFIGNSATNNGGAIYNFSLGTINFIAATDTTGGLTLFSGNKDSTGSNAIYNGGIVNFNAGVQGTHMGIIDVQDYISGNSGTININGTVYKADGTTPITAPSDGFVMLNTVSGNNLTHHTGALSFADGVAEEEFSSGTFSTIDGSVLYVDADLGASGTKIDTISATGGTMAGTVAFRMLSDGAVNPLSSIFSGSTVSGTYATAYTNDYNYSYASGTFTQSGTAGSNNGLNLAIEGTDTRTFSLTKDYAGDGGTFNDGGILTLFGNMKDALADNLTSDSNIKYGTDLYGTNAGGENLIHVSYSKLNVIDMLILNADTAITNTSGNVMVYNSVFSINNTALENNGNAYIFNSTFDRNTARAIENTGVLQLSNVNFLANEHTEKGSAIYSTQDITLHAQAGDYIISGNKTTSGGDNYNAIYLDGENKNLTFQLDAGGSYTLNDNVQASNAYTVNVKGSGVLNLNNTFIGASAVNVTNTTLNLGTASFGSGSLGTAALNVTNGTVNINADANMQGAVNLISSSLNVQSSKNISFTSDLIADKASSIDISGANMNAQLDSFGTVDFSASAGNQFDYTFNINDFIATAGSTLTLTSGGGVVTDATLNSLKSEMATDIFNNSSLSSIINLDAYKTPSTGTLTDVNNFIQVPTESIGAGNLTYKGNTIFAAIRAGDSTVSGTNVELVLTGKGNNTTLSQGTMTVSEDAHLTLGEDGSPSRLFFDGDITVDGGDSKLTVNGGVHMSGTDNIYHSVTLTDGADLVVQAGKYINIKSLNRSDPNASSQVNIYGRLFLQDAVEFNTSDFATQAGGGKIYLATSGSLITADTLTLNGGENLELADGAYITAEGGLILSADTTLTGGKIGLRGQLSGATLTVNNASSTLVINYDATTADTSPLSIQQGELVIQENATLTAGADIEFGSGGTLQIYSAGNLDISGDKLTANLQDFGALTPNGYNASFTKGGTVHNTLTGDAGTALILNGAAGEITLLDNYNELIAQMKTDIFGAGYAGSLTINGYGQYKYLTEITAATHEPDNPIAAGGYKINETSTFAGIAKDVRHNENNSTISGGGTLNLTGNTGNTRILSKGNITVTDGNLNLGYTGAAETLGGTIEGDLIVNKTGASATASAYGTDVTVTGKTEITNGGAFTVTSGSTFTSTDGISVNGTNSFFIANEDVTVASLALTDSGAVNVDTDKTVSVSSSMVLMGGSMSVGAGTLEAAGFTNTTATLTLTGGILRTTDGMTTDKNITIENGAGFDLAGGNMNVSGVAFTAGAGASLLTVEGTTFTAGIGTIGVDTDGATSGAATVVWDASDSVLGNVVIDGLTTRVFDFTDTIDEQAFIDLSNAAKTAYGNDVKLSFNDISFSGATLTIVGDNGLVGFADTTVSLGNGLTAGTSAIVGAVAGDGTTPLEVGTGSHLTITGNSTDDNNGWLYNGPIEVTDGAVTLGTGTVASVTNTGGSTTLTGGTHITGKLQFDGVTSKLKVEGTNNIVGTLQTTSAITYTVGDSASTIPAGITAANVNFADSTIALHDPAWVNGAGIAGASYGVYQKFVNDEVNAHLIAGQNSYVVIGDADSAWAKEAFNNSGLTWGQSAITSALFVKNPHTLTSTGSLVVHGGITADAGGNPVVNGTSYNPSADSIFFSSNSLLVVDANSMYDATGAGVAAITGNGQLTTSTGAHLHIEGGKDKQALTIVDGFVGGAYGVVNGAWGNLDGTGAVDTNTLTLGSTAINVESVDWDAINGIYTVNLKLDFDAQTYAPWIQNATSNYLTTEMVNDPNVGLDPDSPFAGHKMLSRALSTTYGLGADNPKLAIATIEGTAQLGAVANVAGSSMNAAEAAGGAIWARNSLTGMGDNASKPVVMMTGKGSINGGSSLDGGVNGGVNSGSANVKSGMAAWLMPLYKWNTGAGFGAGNLEHGYEGGLGGIAFGADYTHALSEDSAVRFGLALNVGAGYSESNGDFNETSNNFDFWGLSAYGALQKGNFVGTLDVGFSSVSSEISQDLPSTMGMGNLDTEISSLVFTAGLNLEYTFATEFMNITPHVGVRFMNVSSQEYDINSSAGLVGMTEEENQSVWYFPVGVTFSKDIVTSGGWTFTPKLDVGFIAAAGDLNARSSTTFTGVPGTLELEMQNVDGFAFNGGAGFELSNAQNGVSVGFNYNLQLSEHETGHMINATFRYEF